VLSRLFIVKLLFIVKENSEVVIKVTVGPLVIYYRISRMREIRAPGFALMAAGEKFIAIYRNEDKETS